MIVFYFGKSRCPLCSGSSKTRRGSSSILETFGLGLVPRLIQNWRKLTSACVVCSAPRIFFFTTLWADGLRRLQHALVLTWHLVLIFFCQDIGTCLSHRTEENDKTVETTSFRRLNMNKKPFASKFFLHGKKF